MGNFQELDHWMVLAWLVATGLTAFGCVVCWDTGLIQLMVATDSSYLCLVIMALYVLATLYCGRRIGWLADELALVRSVGEAVGERIAALQFDGREVRIDGRVVVAGSILAEHVAALARRSNGQLAQSQDGAAANLLDTLVARTKAGLDVGWFLVDVLLKLGLLGTIVGFILMLASVSDAASIDVNAMQKVLKQMSYGMGTALYTTLAGLVCSMSLGLQYLLLDKGADELIDRVLRLTDSRLAVA